MQDNQSGETRVEEVPAPGVRPGHVLIRATRSLISSGTERSVVEFGRAGYVAKARQQPDRIKKVAEKVATDGLAPTVAAVRGQLARPVAMGYSSVGRVLAVGEGVRDIPVGARVVSNGPHAEVVSVAQNLTAVIPDEVGDDEAAFVVLGSIALQGIRLVAPSLGESVVVYGLGLVGLLGVQILRAHGVRVLGFDVDPSRVELARSFGVDAVDLSSGVDPVEVGTEFAGPAGVDGVLITAATKDNDIVHHAAQMARKRGRIVLTGVVGLQLQRSDFYEKELTFQVSCSYGPGRYDPAYEQDGHDYPIGFVRWTEQRNFAAVLQLLADGRLGVGPLISATYPIAEAPSAYDKLVDREVIALLLEYPDVTEDEVARQRVVQHRPARRPAKGLRGALIGSGAFAVGKLLPALEKTDAHLQTVVSSGGSSAAAAAQRFGIEQSTTDADLVFEDPAINFVVIATRHDSHARYVIRALEAGKSVFVEKPLAITSAELDDIEAAYNRASESGATRPLVMVGFNRRFSPLTLLAKEALKGRRQPLTMRFTCNAGRVPADHWVHDPDVGGGRIIGEACHFIDYLQHFAESPVLEVYSFAVPEASTAVVPDTMSITLRFADGSLGTVEYFSNGSRRYPKETMEVFSDGRILHLDNFRRLTGYGFSSFKRKRLLSQDKGHEEQMRRFVDAVHYGGRDPIDFADLMNTSRASIAAAAGAFTVVKLDG